MTDPAEPTTDEERAILIAFLAMHSAVCPLCGYDLHLLRSPRCPECGRELKLTVGMVQPYLSAWVALLVTTCASGGFGLFCIAMLIKEGWPKWGRLHEGLLDATFTFHLAMPAIALLVFLLRRKLLQLPRPTQWALFGIVLVICAIVFAMFMSVVK